MSLTPQMIVDLNRRYGSQDMSSNQGIMSTAYPNIGITSTRSIVDMTSGEVLGSLDPIKSEVSPGSSGIVNNIIGDSNEFVDGDTSIRDDKNAVSSDASAIDSATNEFINSTPFSETTEGQEAIDALNTMRSNLGILTDAETEAISAEADAAGKPYDVLIEQAKQEKQKGMASSLIRAGQRGGLMSTQFAGVAALMKTEGGDYVGAGGALERVKSVYDLNIQNLEAKKQQAISQAKSAAQKAILTGKREDLDLALDFYNLAKKSYDDSIQLAKEKGEAMRAVKDQQIRIAQFEAGEARANRTQALAEAQFNYKVSEDQKKNAIDNIKRMAESRIDISGLTDEEISQLEYDAGLVPGTFEAFYSNLFEDAQRGILLDNLELEQKIASINSTKASTARTYQLMNKEKEGMTDEEKAMWADVDILRTDLESGKIVWGQAYYTLKSKYNAPDEFIDKQLNKEKWYQTGAYEKQETERKAGQTQSEKDYMEELKNSGYSKKEIEEQMRFNLELDKEVKTPPFIKKWLEENF